MKNLTHVKGKKVLFLVIIGLVIFSGWTSRHTNELKNAEWLIGTWENKTARGSIYETWDKTSASEFAGKSYIVKEKDTVVFETLRLVQEKDKLFYIPTVKDQNDGLPVRFTAKTVSGTELVFENPQHDFPQVIAYTKAGTDSLVAQISGTRNGQERRQVFHMKRVR